MDAVLSLARSHSKLQNAWLHGPPVDVRTKALCQQPFLVGPERRLRGGRPWGLQGPRAAVSSASEVRATPDSADGSSGLGPPLRSNSRKGGKLSGGVNGGSEDSRIDDVRVERSDSKAAARRVLQMLDDGLADITVADQDVMPRNKKREAGHRSTMFRSTANPARQARVPETSQPAGAVLSEIAKTIIVEEREAAQSVGAGRPKDRPISNGDSEIDARPLWQRVPLDGHSDSSWNAQNGLKTQSDVTRQEVKAGGVAVGEGNGTVVGRSEELERQSAGREYEARQLSSAERRAARKGLNVNGVSRLPAVAAPDSLTSADTGTLTSAPESGLERAARLASTGERFNRARRETPAHAAGPLPRQTERRNAMHADVSSRSPNVSDRSASPSEASTSGAPHHDGVPTVGSLRSEPPPGRPAAERPPRQDRSQGGIRSREPGDPPFRKREKQEPLVVSVAAALQRLGRDFEQLDGALVRAVPAELLGRMNLEYWNEVVKLLARGGWCRQMEAVLAYLPRVGYEPNETTYARVSLDSSFDHL